MEKMADTVVWELCPVVLEANAEFLEKEQARQQARTHNWTWNDMPSAPLFPDWV